jgi:hypothetical protein
VAYGFGKWVPSGLAVAAERGGSADTSRRDAYFFLPVATHGYSASTYIICPPT